MNKVTFKNDEIMVNGEVVGRLDGSKEVYVRLLSEQNKLEVVARFKYRSPKASAKDWLKFILQFYNSMRLVQLLHVERKVAPLTLAENHGYVSPQMKELLKFKAEQDRLRNTPVIILNHV